MTATFHDVCHLLNGSPAAGRLRVDVDTEGNTVRDLTGHVVFSGPLFVRLVDGAATFTVPATDVDTLSVRDFTYTITEELDHQDPDDWRVVVTPAPDGFTVEIADLETSEDAEAVDEPGYAQHASLAALLALGARVTVLEDSGGSGGTLLTPVPGHPLLFTIGA